MLALSPLPAPGPSDGRFGGPWIQDSPQAPAANPQLSLIQPAGLGAPPRPLRRLAVVVQGQVPVRSYPAPFAAVRASCRAGEFVAAEEYQGFFLRIRTGDGQEGWVPAAALQILDLPPQPPPSAGPAPQPPSLEPLGAHTPVVAQAMLYLGVPYVWGGTSEWGMDCSGFVQRVFGEEGIHLPRVADRQACVGIPIPPEALEPGDRLYFQTESAVDHTGIYIGDGRFIHASGSAGCVTIDNFFAPKWQRLFAWAMR